MRTGVLIVIWLTVAGVIIGIGLGFIFSGLLGCK